MQAEGRVEVSALLAGVDRDDSGNFVGVTTVRASHYVEVYISGDPVESEIFSEQCRPTTEKASADAMKLEECLGDCELASGKTREITARWTRTQADNPWRDFEPASEPYNEKGRGPVVVMLFHCNRPDMLELQVDSLTRFVCACARV